MYLKAVKITLRQFHIHFEDTVDRKASENNFKSMHFYAHNTTSHYHLDKLIGNNLTLVLDQPFEKFDCWS